MLKKEAFLVVITLLKKFIFFPLRERRQKEEKGKEDKAEKGNEVKSIKQKLGNEDGGKEWKIKWKNITKK